MFICEFCNKEFKRNCNLIQHKNSCRKNPKNLSPCKMCGIIPKEQFGSGRFCSKKCSASFSTSKNKQERSAKISKVLTNSGHNDISKQCLNCKKTFLVKYKKRNQKYCSVKCVNTCSLLKQKLSTSLQGRTGGYRKGSGRGKGGWYKGFYCDSTWELCYIIYCLDHNIDIKRNTEKFTYLFNGKELNYLPDFIVENEYVEIKGYVTEQWKAKESQFPHKLEVIGKDEINQYINYITENYEFKHITDLYTES
tara:strand:+ start:3912 stop:4664 length:753 start_codon:yes stop_codon:yes gene_type:complete